MAAVANIRHQNAPLSRPVSGNAKLPGAWSAIRGCWALVPPCGSASVQSGLSGSPTEIPQFRIPVAIPTEIPRTKRHYAVRLLCLLKVRNTLADRRLCAWAGLLEFFQVGAFRVIELLKSGRSRAVTSQTLEARVAYDELFYGLMDGTVNGAGSSLPHKWTGALTWARSLALRTRRRRL